MGKWADTLSTRTKVKCKIKNHLLVLVYLFTIFKLLILSFFLFGAMKKNETWLFNFLCIVVGKVNKLYYAQSKLKLKQFFSLERGKRITLIKSVRMSNIFKCVTFI